MFIFGGFDKLFPTLPTNTMIKIELGEMFLENEDFLKVILEHVIV